MVQKKSRCSHQLIQCRCRGGTGRNEGAVDVADVLVAQHLPAACGACRLLMFLCHTRLDGKLVSGLVLITLRFRQPFSSSAGCACKCGSLWWRQHAPSSVLVCMSAHQNNQRTFCAAVSTLSPGSAAYPSTMPDAFEHQFDQYASESQASITPNQRVLCAAAIATMCGPALLSAALQLTKLVRSQQWWRSMFAVLVAAAAKPAAFAKLPNKMQPACGSRSSTFMAAGTAAKPSAAAAVASSVQPQQAGSSHGNPAAAGAVLPQQLQDIAVASDALLTAGCLFKGFPMFVILNAHKMCCRLRLAEPMGIAESTVLLSTAHVHAIT